MTAGEKSMNEIIKDVYNGSIVSVKKIIPIDPEVSAPKLIQPPLRVDFGVMIGYTGNVKGELILQSNDAFFSHIGEKMFGMPVEGDMLDSFAGELGNMIAGSLSTYLSEQGLTTDITHPTILKGDATLSGFKRALLVEVAYPNDQILSIYLLLNN
ncbi:CheY-P phosphatase CheX [Halolactibacillus alkaliphilus]|uniref:CheY-P phosphatase CheX n=1 Tax=Halolactibacillus alkaliphilus TaxID=442899 RepID=A0A511X341_9BACI|nr:chemotaxis protein CheX [Halolactibacillus alkaliphilus]GEN57369.1 CheY-P phosphatase CheX [Halolactibacillus alkaliphilus]GGN73174.1 CheY-P phosphatase CheX [Halolactibacillus alkaliphilus]SFO94148.1 chemotaxis protein CheX [Halolactibacillus alkaliphilus]